MIILITMKRGTSQHVFVDCIGQLEVPSDVSDDIYRKVNARAAYLTSELRPSIMVGSTMVDDGWIIGFRSYAFIDERVKKFFETYENSLHRMYFEKPDQYLEIFALTVARMKEAILKGSFNKDSDAFKLTCKELKIKHTYKAIEAYLKGDSNGSL